MPASQNPQLYVKSYFASSVQDAIETARHEMGADALLLNTRPAGPEGRHLGEFEVVFGAYKAAQHEVPEVRLAPPGTPRQLEDLSRQIDELRNLMLRNAVAAASAHRYQSLLEHVLVEAGVEASLAGELEDGVQKRLKLRNVDEGARLNPQDERYAGALTEEAVAEIGDRLTVQPELSRITAFVGPPGAGKTTTLVKLAVSRCLKAGRPVRLISADTQRVGAADQLYRYAGILGVPFQEVESAAALAQAIDVAPPNADVLVDTPGLSPALMDDFGAEFSALLNQRQEIDTQLVLTAVGRPADLTAAAKRFETFRPSGLIFTRIDEAESLGPLFCLAARSKKPISYLCDGQLIPEDISPASTARIAESLVRNLPRLLTAAA